MYVAISRETGMMGKPTICYFDTIEEMGCTIRLDEEWEIYKLDPANRIRVHAVYIQELYEQPSEIAHD